MFVQNWLGRVTFAALLVIVVVSQTKAQDFDLFLRIDGQDAINAAGADVPISLIPGQSYLGQAILRERTGAPSRLEQSGGFSSNLINIGVDTMGSTTIGGVVSVFASPRPSPTPGFTLYGFGGNQDASTTDLDGLGGQIKGVSLGRGANPALINGSWEALAGQFNISFGADGRLTTIPFTPPAGGVVNTLADSFNTDIGPLTQFRTATIATAVPEPGSFVMLGVGAAGMVMRRRRR